MHSRIDQSPLAKTEKQSPICLHSMILKLDKRLLILFNFFVSQNIDNQGKYNFEVQICVSLLFLLQARV